jgi:diaminohydroxyphosphoribosylaminopyrimidine deaminase / 5-amino-6-(5-phosphoribosylamino)uracil reductase
MRTYNSAKNKDSKIRHFSEDELWDMLLQLKNDVKSSVDDIYTVTILLHDSFTEIYYNQIPVQAYDIDSIIITRKFLYNDLPARVLFQLNENFGVTLIYNHILEKDQADFLVSYLPYCSLPWKAHRLGRAVSVLHFAQTLDGRIATENGNSKWIGNQENLIHSHRMRALCDGILIGGNTLKNDKPALTVRHVKGVDPVKVVIGSSSFDFESLLESNGRIILFSSRKSNAISGIEKVEIPGKSGHILPSRILRELYKMGIDSILIEGGSQTASSFIKDRSLDVLQLFFSPRIFGSGICNFSLPTISSVDDSINFRYSSFKNMGDGVLFEGEVNYPEA